MDVMEAIKLRRSIRGYKDKPVEEEKLKIIL
ncbi:TPA: nitroreductase, partial [Candidatus Poribacteria bacterium]|nr:nitroreductase [Candidatus Poribacteria bacterium]